MMLLALVLVALVVSLLFGGRLERLAEVRFSKSYLILAALGIQILVFSERWQSTVSSELISNALYIASLLILAWALWLNRRVPGMIALGTGLVMNALVIMANGGRMPAALSAIQSAGIASSEAEFLSQRLTNSSLIAAGTPLWFLGDIFAIPKGTPLANVYSLGDVLITIGGAWFVYANTRTTPPAPDVSTPQA